MRFVRGRWALFVAAFSSLRDVSDEMRQAAGYSRIALIVTGMSSHVRGDQLARAQWDRHPVLPQGLDGCRNIGVCVTQEVLGLAAASQPFFALRSFRKTSKCTRALRSPKSFDGRATPGRWCCRYRWSSDLG
jgi:hypothetical protein